MLPRALVLFVTACSSSGATTATTPTTVPESTTEPTTTMAPTTTTTTTSAPTTTTIPAAGYSNLNGMPVYDEELLDRRTLMVKIDNSVPARPAGG